MIEILTGGLLVSLALVARRWSRERTRRREMERYGRRPGPPRAYDADLYI